MVLGSGVNQDGREKDEITTVFWRKPGVTHRGLSVTAGYRGRSSSVVPGAGTMSHW